MCELNENEKAQLAYLFTPEGLGIPLDSFNKLTKMMEKQTPAEMLKNLKTFKRRRASQLKKQRQLKVEAFMGIDCTSVTQLPENVNRKVEMMYPKDNPHSKPSILCNAERKANKSKRGNINFRDESPERRFYVPGQKIRPETKCEEELEPSFSKCRKKSKLPTYSKAPSRANYKSQLDCGPLPQRSRASLSSGTSRIPIRSPTRSPMKEPVCEMPSPEVYEPPPGTICQTPKRTMKQVSFKRGRGFEKQPVCAEEEQDDINYLSNTNYGG